MHLACFVAFLTIWSIVAGQCELVQSSLTYYVSLSGVPTGSCTEDQPCLDFQSVVNNVLPLPSPPTHVNVFIDGGIYSSWSNFQINWPPLYSYSFRPWSPGQNVTLDAQGFIINFPIWTFTGSSVEIMNVIFENVRVNGSLLGGALYFNNALNCSSASRIQECRFINNSIVTTGGQAGGAAVAIDAGPGSVTIASSVFDGNTIFNSSGDGGALWISIGNDVTVLESIFINNTVLDGGAAIRTNGSPGPSLTIDGCYFARNNQLTGSGGVITLGAGRLYMINTTIVDNHINNGALLGYSGIGNTDAAITDCVFDNPSGEYDLGGGINTELRGSNQLSWLRIDRPLVNRGIVSQVNHPSAVVQIASTLNNTGQWFADVRSWVPLAPGGNISNSGRIIFRSPNTSLSVPIYNSPKGQVLVDVHSSAFSILPTNWVTGGSCAWYNLTTKGNKDNMIAVPSGNLTQDETSQLDFYFANGTNTQVIVNGSVIIDGHVAIETSNRDGEWALVHTTLGATIAQTTSLIFIPPLPAPCKASLFLTNESRIVSLLVANCVACTGRAPAPGAVCVGLNEWIIPSDANGTIVISPGQTVVINGTLNVTSIQISITNNSDQFQPSITVLDSVNLGGTLTLELSFAPSDGIIIPILTAENITGNFSLVEVIQPDRCIQTSPSVGQSESTLYVLIDTEQRCSRDGLSTAAIAGIAVGAAVFLALALAIIAYILFRNGILTRLFRRKLVSRAHSNPVY